MHTLAPLAVVTFSVLAMLIMTINATQTHPAPAIHDGVLVALPPGMSPLDLPE